MSNFVTPGGLRIVRNNDNTLSIQARQHTVSDGTELIGWQPIPVENPDGTLVGDVITIDGSDPTPTDPDSRLILALISNYIIDVDDGNGNLGPMRNEPGLVNATVLAAQGITGPFYAPLQAIVDANSTTSENNTTRQVLIVAMDQDTYFDGLGFAGQQWLRFCEYFRTRTKASPYHIRVASLEAFALRATL